MLNRLFAVLAVFAATVVFAGTAHATVILDWSVEDLTRNADAVVVGQVVKQWSSADTQRGVVYQHIEVQVSESIRGKASVGETLHVVQLGGEHAGIRARLAGTAEFTKNEQVALFLEERRAEGKRIEDHWLVTGMFLGKFKLEQTDTGADVVRNRLVNGVMLVDGAGRPKAPEALGRELRMSLDQLRNRVVGVKEVK